MARIKNMTAQQHVAKAASLNRRSKLHGGLFGRGTKKRMVNQANLHATLAIQSQLAAQQPPAPGWYQDPHGVTSWRYWNGTGWTEHTS
jgi:hypothetical protein